MNAVRYDEIGNWSELKLEIVRSYAKAYSTILHSQETIKRHIYIDAFAGAGKHISKSTGDFVLGSPLNALLVEPPFSEFHFIDLNRKRLAVLSELAGERPNVAVYEGDCNEVLIRDVFPRCRWEDYARALCLLDPYALNVDWSVLQTAGQMKTIEIFYNFMIMDANMNVLWKNPDKVSQTQVARMTAVWGDHSWRTAAYTKQRGLFNDFEEKATNKKVTEAFRSRLKEVAGFAFVPDPLPMKNSTGATVYYLFFASPNRTGAKIVKEIFDKYRGN
jgi:three-Cys-motif partner protein